MTKEQIIEQLVDCDLRTSLPGLMELALVLTIEEVIGS